MPLSAASKAYAEQAVSQRRLSVSMQNYIFVQLSWRFNTRSYIWHQNFKSKTNGNLWKVKIVESLLKDTIGKDETKMVWLVLKTRCTFFKWLIWLHYNNFTHFHIALDALNFQGKRHEINKVSHCHGYPRHEWSDFVKKYVFLIFNMSFFRGKVPEKSFTSSLASRGRGRGDSRGRGWYHIIPYEMIWYHII